MRLLIITLLFSFTCQGQIINASGNYRVRASGCTDSLLDCYPGANAAYSLRLLDVDYVGSAIRVRRSSDNAEQDIGFSGGNLDTASLKTFVGSDSGYVTTFYDQANSNDLTQATSTKQPRIVDAGTIERVNGKPSVRFISSSNGSLFRTFTNSQPANYFVVFNEFSYDNTQVAGLNNIYDGRTADYMESRLTSETNMEHYAGSLFGATTIAKLTTYVLNVQFNSTSSEVYLNATTIGTGLNSGTLNSGGLTMGNYNTGNRAFDGHISEFVIYSSTSMNRVGIRSNINNFYSIY